tara:strand:+ start:813 stop:1085 length:273 start_codon:yes stop_codon:yes gene_type:complete
MNKIIEIENSSRCYHELTQEYTTHIMNVKLDGVFEGYELDCYKVESEINHELTWYECSSYGGRQSFTNSYDTKEEMMDYITEWVNELNSK